MYLNFKFNDAPNTVSSFFVTVHCFHGVHVTFEDLLRSSCNVMVSDYVLFVRLCLTVHSVFAWQAMLSML